METSPGTSPAAVRGQPALPAGAAQLFGTAPACRVPVAFTSPARNSPRDTGGEGAEGMPGIGGSTARGRRGRDVTCRHRGRESWAKRRRAVSARRCLPPFPAAPPGVAGVSPSPRWRGAMSSPPRRPRSGPTPPPPPSHRLPPPPAEVRRGAAPTAAAVREEWGGGGRARRRLHPPPSPALGTAMGSSRRSSCRRETPLRMSAAGGLVWAGGGGGRGGRAVAAADCASCALPFFSPARLPPAEQHADWPPRSLRCALAAAAFSASCCWQRSPGRWMRRERGDRCCGSARSFMRAPAPAGPAPPPRRSRAALPRRARPPGGPAWRATWSSAPGTSATGTTAASKASSGDRSARRALARR